MQYNGRPFVPGERFAMNLRRVNKMNANRQHPQRAQQASAAHMRVPLPKGNLKVAQFQISLSSSTICCEYFSTKYGNSSISASVPFTTKGWITFIFSASINPNSSRTSAFRISWLIVRRKLLNWVEAFYFQLYYTRKRKQRRFVIIVRRSARQLLRLIRVNPRFIAMRCRVFRRPASFVVCQEPKRAKRSLIAKSHVAKSKSILSAHLKAILFDYVWYCTGRGLHPSKKLFAVRKSSTMILLIALHFKDKIRPEFFSLICLHQERL